MKDIPAFPVQDAYSMSTERGMTLRDYFAAKAMQGFAAMDDDCFSSVEKMAEMSYKWADAMMKERNK